MASESEQKLLQRLVVYAAAIVALLEGPKTVAEGAGASSVAAYLFDKVDTSLKTVALVSGGNASPPA